MYNRAVKKIVLGWVLLLILVALFGRVTVAEPNSGRTAADFLNIGLGARSAGLGGAYSAISTDANASYWNPAGLAELSAGEVTFGHFSWYQDISLNHGSFAHRINDSVSMAASLTFLGYGDIEAFEIDGSASGDNISAYDWSGALSFGYRVTDNISIGVTGQFINQKLDDVSGTAFAADLGLRFSTELISVGAVVANLGSGMTFDDVKEDLPALARFGVAVRPFGETILTSVEIETQAHGETVWRQGVELGFSNQYYLRSGYNYYPGQDDRSLGSGIALGAGLKYSNVRLDYAFTPGEKYSSEDLHRISIAWQFGK